jgi:hypothetical protein
MKIKLQDCLPTCPGCQKKIFPSEKSIVLNVLMGDANKTYTYCGQDCLDKQVNKIKTKPVSDGIFYPEFVSMHKISDYPKKWQMILKVSELNWEMI